MVLVPRQLWWYRSRYELWPADVAAAVALMRGLLWCAAPQAAAAVLALLLKGRRRRAPAFVALTLSVANQWMYAGITDLSRANAPGDILLAFQTAAVFAVAALELLGFLVLLLGAAGSEEE